GRSQDSGYNVQQWDVIMWWMWWNFLYTRHYLCIVSSINDKYDLYFKIGYQQPVPTTR
ncbi:hypothetical protein MKW98_027144, partial [Papaver atlanticum]